MKVIFLGTPEFAVSVLDAINRSRHEVVAVVTQPDRVNGRKNKITFGKVKEYALQKGLPVLQFPNVSKDGEETLRALSPDVMVTCAYGQILRQNILDICPIYNVHASLLPKYRGSSPVQWALINGEKEVGVTVMKTELGVDTGDMMAKDKIVLSGEENAEETLALLSHLGADLIVQTLDKAEKGELTFEKQKEEEATHCRMLVKADGKLDFTKSAEEVKNFIRGMTPWPGAFTTYNGGTIKILKAATEAGEGKPGEIVLSDPKKGFVVACGTGHLRLLVVQGENGKAMDAKAYLLGHKIPVGSTFD